MLNKILKWIVDILFRTNSIKDKFNKHNPNNQILVFDWVKMIKSKTNQWLEYNPKWITSKRTVIMLNNNKIIFWDKEILLKNIIKAELLKIKSMFIDGQVLLVSTNNGFDYQFWMQYNPEWIKQKALPLKYKIWKIKYSIFSILLRVFLVLYVIYIIAEKFK